MVLAAPPRPPALKVHDAAFGVDDGLDGLEQAGDIAHNKGGRHAIFPRALGHVPRLFRRAPSKFARVVVGQPAGPCHVVADGVHQLGEKVVVERHELRRVQELHHDAEDAAAEDAAAVLHECSLRVRVPREEDGVWAVRRDEEVVVVLVHVEALLLARGVAQHALHVLLI